MPKIIPDLRNRILSAARDQLQQYGFAGLSLRNVAKSCGIAVGTTYNYFSSKVELAVNAMQDDWNNALNEVSLECSSFSTPEDGMAAIYHAIRKFINSYAALFHEEDARTRYADLISRHHARLVTDITAVVKCVCTSFGFNEPEERLQLISAMVLAAASNINTREEDFRILTRRLFAGMRILPE